MKYLVDNSLRDQLSRSRDFQCDREEDLFVFQQHKDA